MPIAAAIPAIIGGVGSIAGGALASHGANKAAATQASAADKSAALQKQAADESLAFQKQQYQENVQRQQPWLEAGQGALGKLNTLQPFQAPGAAGMSEDPGYQFRLAEGQKAMQNSAAARGNLAGGAALKAAERYGQGAASQEYQKVYARRSEEYQNQLNQLQGLAGVGQTTATNLGASGANTASSMGNTAQYGANQQGGALQNAAAARASGYVNSGNTWGNAISGIGSTMGDLYSMRRPRSTPPFAPYESYG